MVCPRWLKSSGRVGLDLVPGQDRRVPSRRSCRPSPAGCESLRRRRSACRMAARRRGGPPPAVPSTRGRANHHHRSAAWQSPPRLEGCTFRQRLRFAVVTRLRAQRRPGLVDRDLRSPFPARPAAAPRASVSVQIESVWPCPWGTEPRRFRPAQRGAPRRSPRAGDVLALRDEDVHEIVRAVKVVLHIWHGCTYRYACMRQARVRSHGASAASREPPCRPCARSCAILRHAAPCIVDLDAFGAQDRSPSALVPPSAYWPNCRRCARRDGTG